MAVEAEAVIQAHQALLVLMAGQEAEALLIMLEEQEIHRLLLHLKEVTADQEVSIFLGMDLVEVAGLVELVLMELVLLGVMAGWLLRQP
jgi:phage gp46-like protein